MNLKESLPSQKSSATGSSLLQEESKRMSEKIKQLQSHMQREREKRHEITNLPDSGKVSSMDTSTTYSPSPEIECPVFVFLKSIGMERYHSNFLSNQVNSLEKLRDVSETFMENLKIPIGHRLKILKNLKTLQESQSFNEKIEKRQDFGIKTEEKQDSGLFKLTSNGLSTITSKNFGFEVKTEESYSLNEKKTCWNCFKVKDCSEGIEAYKKFFCCGGCVAEFEKTEMKLCECGNRMLRWDGVYFEDKWICKVCEDNRRIDD